MKRARRLLIVTLSLLALAGSLLITARVYLRSDRVRVQAVSRLESLYGGPVRLAGIDIGAAATTLHGLELLEEGAGPSDPPWLSVREADLDLTALDLLDGQGSPREVILIGASVVLRFDRSNRLLTRLPRPRHGSGAFPPLRIRDGRLTIRQEGRADMVVSGIDLALRADGRQLTASGAAADPLWGNWSINGTLDMQAGTGAFELKTARARVTPGLLEALAFVPPGVWRQFQAEGDTPVDLTLRFDPGVSGVHYRIVLAPEAARLRLAAIDLEAEQVRGQVVIADGRVQLNDLRGRSAGGEIALAGDLDFRAAPPCLRVGVTVRELDVRRLPGTWGLPPLVEGHLDGQAQLQIVLSPDRQRTRGDGQGTISAVRIAGQPARPIDLRLRSDRLEATIVMEDAEVEDLLRNAGIAAPFPIAGRLSFQVQGAIPLDTPRDRSTYRANGTVKSARLEMNSCPIEGIEAAVQLRDGTLSVTGLHTFVDGMPAAAAVEVELAEPCRCRARVDVRDGDVAVLHRRLPQLLPALDVEGRFAFTAGLRGTLRPLVLAAEGTGRLSRLKLDDVKIDQIGFRWNSDGRRLNVPELSGTLYRGRLSGSLIVPLREGEPGSAALRFEQLDLNLLARDVPGLPVEVQGEAGGTLQGRLGSGGPGQPQELSARVELQSARLRVQGLPIEEFGSTISYRNSVMDYVCEGQALGGRVQLEGRLPSRRPGPAGTAPEGRLRVEGVQLARLWPEWGAGESLRQLEGSVDLEIGFRHEDADGWPAGSGRFVLSRVRWNDGELAGSLRGDVLVDRRALRLRDVTATVGEGLLQAQAGLDFDRPERGWFNVNLQHVEASRLLAPWGGSADHIQGPVDLRLRGTFGREWSGAGRVLLARGRVFGVEVADLQAPVDLVFSPRFGHGQLHVREGGAQVALGRATARASLGWGSGTRLEGQVRFFSVDVRTALRQAMQLSQVGAGRVSGRIDFGANDLRSVDDLSASVEASFAQTQALELPVLRELAPYLTPGQSSSPVFPSGELRANLSRGVVRVQRLALTGPLLQVLVEGTATLQGRLDLSATANTGRSDLGSAGSRLPAGGLPLGVFRQASGFLANRLVRLRIAGTARSPAIQVEPLPVLTDEALRFFLGRS